MSAKELLDKQFDWYDKSPTSGIKLYFECVVIDAMEEYATLKLQEQAKEIERLKGENEKLASVISDVIRKHSIKDDIDFNY